MNLDDMKPPPAPEPAAARKKKRRNQPTLKRFTRRNVLRATAVMGACLVAFEAMQQVRIQMAAAQVADGEYTEALGAVEGLDCFLFRRGTVREIADAASYHMELDAARASVTSRNWFLAQSSLDRAGKCAARLGSDAPEALEVIRDWGRQLDAMIDAGELLKAQRALDSLGKVGIDVGETATALRQAGRQAAARLAERFRDKESWTAAIAEVERARALAIDEETGDRLAASIRDALVAAIHDAVDAGEFEKARGLTRLRKSAYGDASDDATPTLAAMQIEESLRLADAAESRGKLEQALEHLDRALILSTGRRSIFERVRDLRERLHRASVHPGDAGSTDLTAFDGQYRSWSRQSIASGATLSRASQRFRLRHSHVVASWTVDREHTDSGSFWVVRVRLNNVGSRVEDAAGNLTIGAVTAARRPTRLLHAARHIVPHLLAGSSEEFELRLPRHDEDTTLHVGQLR